MATNRSYGTRGENRGEGLKPELSPYPISFESEIVAEKTAVTTVRRIGYVAMKAHEALEAALISSGYQRLASDLRNSLKPLCDALMHFTIEVEQETDDVL